MQRIKQLNNISQQFKVNPVVAILGPRQCGKTTLAKNYASSLQETVTLFDLENPLHLAKLENPLLALQSLEGLIVIDEIQLRPNLFPVLRTLVDNHRDKQRYLILGSASRDLIQQSSETLAGRISYIELTPFSMNEVGETNKLWLQGGFPRAYLAETMTDSLIWREQYIKTFLERDIPNLGFNIPAMSMRRFWMMLLHYHGNIYNAAEIGRSLGITHKVIKHYVDILSGTFMVRQLSPWFENISKRQVKSPKIYFRDSGIMHSLMGIADQTALLNHPKLGASWEGFALEEIMRREKADETNSFFWSTHSGAECDLIILKGDRKYGYEFKYSDQPKITKSMRIALADLKLELLRIIIPGNEHFKLSEKVEVYGLDALNQDLN